MKILLFVLALWAFMSIAPSDGKDVRRHYGRKGTICKKGHHWIVKIKCTNKCKIHKPKAAFERGGRVRITGRVGAAFRQKKKSCGRNCFCAKTSKPKWNQVFCKNHKGKKITSDRVHFDIWCIKRTTKLRFRAYVKNIGKPRMMERKCPSGQNRHEDGVCRKCENKQYDLPGGAGCAACNCSVNGSKFLSCETATGRCKCKAGYKDRDCTNCTDQYYKINGTGECKACGCDKVGSTNGGKCNNAGNCTCNAESNGVKCDGCLAADKYRPEAGGPCTACGCNTLGTKGGAVGCDRKGQCDCQAGKSGLQCN